MGWGGWGRGGGEGKQKLLGPSLCMKKNLEYPPGVTV